MRVSSFLLALLLAAPFARADDATPTLETVVVSGEQPGPGLWRVSKDGHEMFILGTLSPLPRKMKWISRDVEATIARSQEILLGPSAQLSVDGGVFGAVLLLPSLLGVRNNPDEKKLADVLPPELYARWVPLRDKFLGRGGAIEKRRPLVAAAELYENAVERSGLVLGGVVGPVVEKAAKKHKVPTTEPEVAIKIAEPKSVIKEFKRTALDDGECFAQTLTRVESDLEPMKARANAWASGDIEALRALPYVDQRLACDRAFLGVAAAKRTGLTDLRERLAVVWLDAAEKALAKNETTFAALPIAQILEADGLVERLRAKGYTVEAPE
jgi:uncharacterized protein YbaP (TraB family)